MTWSPKTLHLALLALLAAGSLAAHTTDASEIGPVGTALTAEECSDEEPAVFAWCDDLEGAEREICLLYPDRRIGSECPAPSPLSCGS